ncbi:NAD(P)H-quinone oxidoreductase [Inhella gelatinilytica]|uniref:NAD(P)H-quinone oxidoreductase n=1 Tax=Inhella gelatinilytica TaxID=2795030 RepID=A0A931NF22_9BURK|nr:NAD(P)H-quinone oxidoreductase [Inhella gelatinilytica]MBH9553820.1 NAD(P)H-quinone oxidoreductase [Inhella gelatinilytica]
MKGIAIRQPGGPEVLEMIECPEPRTGEGECLIGVVASGLNRPDLLQRRGLYPPPPGCSSLPGLEVAGHVLSGDPAALRAQGLAVGDAVMALVGGGGYAERCVASVSHCLPLPAGWTLEEGAGLPETFFTVWSNLFDQGNLRAGETLLIHGGSSGIGTTAIQLAKAFGAHVLVTVGNKEKAAACCALGADAAILYREEDFVSEVLALTSGRGADLILDMVGGDYLGRDQRCLAEDGRIQVIAVQGGTKAEVDAGLLLRKRQRIAGSTLRPRANAFKAAIAEQLRHRVWPLLVTRQIKPVLAAVFPAADVVRAHEALEAGAHVGKLVLRWN